MNHNFNPDQLAEEAAEKAIKNCNDASLSEWLCEIGGYTDRRTFLELLAQIRGGQHSEIGAALMACIRDEALRGIDGDELAHKAYDDALYDALGNARATEAVHREWERS